MNNVSLSLPFLIQGDSPQHKAMRRHQLYDLLEKDNELLADILDLQRKLAKKKDKESRELVDELGEIVQEFLGLNRQKLELTKAINKDT